MAKKTTGIVILFLVFNTLKPSSNNDTAGIFLSGTSRNWLEDTTDICGYRVPTALLESCFCKLDKNSLASLSASASKSAIRAILQLSMLKQFSTEKALYLSLKGCPVSSFIRTRNSKSNIGHPKITDEDRIEADYLSDFYPNFTKLFGMRDLKREDFVEGLSECHDILVLEDRKLIKFVEEYKSKG